MRIYSRDKIDGTHQKALKINLDNRRYGTFAEIGAGQEVVRWFFRVGAAAGTISKSISAYDMDVSDAIYGSCERYVCRERLESMLEHEHKLNLERLKDKRGDSTAFFAFADTVAARSYKGTNDCHGWMGVKFQSHPRDEDSQIVIHVRMRDSENALQQEALGIVGVNLLYGAFFLFHEPEKLLASLLDDLTTERLEIDMVEFSGIEFRHVDNRLMSLRLVELGLSNAAMFDPNGVVLQPSEILRKKSILVERGSFRPVCNVNLDIVQCAHKKFCQEPDNNTEEVIQLMEITMHNLLSTTPTGDAVDYRDFLARADMLAACGQTVLISNYSEYYRLAAYLANHTQRKIGITMGANSLVELFDEKYYAELAGGILESFGRLFKNDLKLYIYPFLDLKNNQITTIENLEIATELRPLYQYLIGKGCIVHLDGYDGKCLKIFSRDVLKKIENGDNTWETMVPAEVSKLIKQRNFFDYKKGSLKRSSSAKKK